MGRLGRDPEIRNLQSGDKIANLVIATEKNWKKDGEWQSETEWHRIVVFDQFAIERIEKYAAKGHVAIVEGELKTRKWQDNSTGQDRYSTEIVVGRFGARIDIFEVVKSEGGGQGNYGASPASTETQDDGDDFDDDIPF